MEADVGSASEIEVTLAECAGVPRISIPFFRNKMIVAPMSEYAPSIAYLARSVSGGFVGLPSEFTLAVQYLA